MKTSKKLVFFGTEDFSAPALRRLIAAGWDVVAVVTKTDAKAGRGQKLQAPQVKQIANAAGIKVLQPVRLPDIVADLKDLQPSHGVLAAYGKIVPQSIIDIFPGGIINIHPSLLPLYRGPAPIEAAILNGDSQTGISLMKLTAGVDEGPVYAQKVVDLPLDMDIILLSPHLAELGTEFLLQKMPAILDGTLSPMPQQDSAATYTKLLKKNNGIIDWSKPAEVLERQVRAYLKWPKSRTNIQGHEIIITKARVAESKDDGILVMKASRGYLEIQELIAPSGRRMSGADFMRGYKQL